MGVQSNGRSRLKKARAVVAKIARRMTRQRSALREAHTAVALMETVVGNPNPLFTTRGVLNILQVPSVLSRTLATLIQRSFAATITAG